MNLRLKRLELLGFKSFADRTYMEFAGSLTGIVGPNGCGKSNVVDAMRWVLGEQRARSMRGGEMADVIFKGSTSRPAMGMAEATMVLDNSDGDLEGLGSEVSLTRRVYKEGEGEYLIDGEKARLKDLRNMLFDTGLGSRGYAVLEQGKIDAVLSANALDRRSIFEEAAGISRYRQRKKEAESRLARVEQDVERVDDILRELTSRVRSLKIQASKAERYVTARDAWRGERTRFLRHKVSALNGELTALGADLCGLEARAVELRAAREQRDADAASREDAQRELAQRVDELGTLVARLAGEGRALDERHAQLSLRIEAWNASAGEEGERAERRAVQLEGREAELEVLQADLEARRGGLTAAEEEARAAADSLREARRAYRELRQRSEEQNELVLGLLHRKTEAQNRGRHLGESRAPLEERRRRAAGRLLEARGAVESMVQAEAEARAERETAEARLGESEEDRADLVRDLDEVDAARTGADEERRAAEIERARVRSRMDALRDWERERESLANGARALLEAQGEPDAPCAAEDLAGVLADRIRTSTHLARALDAALGDRALALVARRPDVVAPVLSWLAQGAVGEVQLVVADGLAPDVPLDLALDLVDRPGPDDPGLIGPLVDYVDCDDGFVGVARALVGDVWIARDTEAALALVARYPRWRFATPAGDLVHATGAQGGHREIAQGAIGRRSAATELEGRAAALDDRITLLVQSAEKLDARRAELAGELERAEEALALRRDAAADALGAERTAAARRTDLESTLELVAAEEAAVAHEEAQLGRDLETAREDLAAAEEAFVAENDALAALEEERHRSEREREDLARGEGTTQVALTRARAELDALDRRRADLEGALAETREELERGQRLVREAQESAAAAGREIEELTTRSRTAADERAAREVELSELRRTEREGRDAIDALRRDLEGVTRELEVCMQEVSRRQLDEQRLSLSRDELLARSREELELGEAELLEGFEPEEELAERDALDALDARVAQLKRELDRLGPVNTEALGELEETQERLDFLTTQRQDLADSRATLLSTLQTINEESRRRFLETFEAVRGAFSVLFRQLFGGGRADLTLEEGVDPLEAGIEISARPPGREMLPIGLLSGGQRTMTALGLLFAVFQTRPSPFCVLDEVDAALDDANVGRFLAMLDGFRRHTQFVVVTHNKGTMSACDMLYGVTMETKGVSRHVSVRFGEVDQFVPEITGDARAASETRREVLDHVVPEAEPEPGAAVEVQVAAEASPVDDADDGVDEGVDDETRVVELEPQKPPAEVPTTVGNGQVASERQTADAVAGPSEEV